MNEEYLVTSHSYRCTSLRGSCGVFELYRINGAYEKSSDMEARHKALQATSGTTTVIQSAISRANTLLSPRLKVIANSTMRWSYPVEWAFAAIVDDVRHNYSPNLLVLTDNMSERGDVHLGACATRHLVKWIQDTGLGQIYETPQRKTHKPDGALLQAWVWHPDWRAVRVASNATNKLLTDYLKEIRNVEKDFTAHQQAENDRIRQQVLSAANW